MDEYLDNGWLRVIRTKLPITFIIIDVDFALSCRSHSSLLMSIFLNSITTIMATSKAIIV
ncbi:MAG: hypothetical protein B6I37_00400 [Desulfobacteraceae bacterium 4572_35.2]|nr:MAG: hypothetical protein B6I37_00400 [Desulfobacteraceae bacterium 4572_35.2]